VSFNKAFAASETLALLVFTSNVKKPRPSLKIRVPAYNAGTEPLDVLVPLVPR
jgi:hypothetical protein